ncbi:MAG TPA: phage tail tube protein [Noviherbaspirillum sp.]
MASRYIRNTVILAKPEVTVGTDPTPTGADNAILVSDMSITPLDAQNIQRNNILGYFGGQEELVGPASVRISFTCELAGSGTASAAPKWGNLLLGCAMAEATLATPDRVEYTPVSTSLKTLTLYYYDDGLLHKVHGAMGNCTLSAKVGDKPTLKFDFVGTRGGETATANATPTLTGWKKPLAMTKANVVDITLGCTYSAGALASGTVYPSTGLEIMLGNAVNFTPLLSSETVDITNRDVTGSMELELTAAQEVTLMTSVVANTTQGLGFTIGTATGYKMIIHAPAMQMLNPRKVDLNGKRLIGFDTRLIPSSGNDELRIACI